MEAAAFELVQRTRVEQAIDGGRFQRFHKELLRATPPSGRPLALVRKWRDDLPRKGVVLLVHGFAQNRYSWHLSSRSFVNHLADRGFDVFNLELTGHGRSRDYGSRPAREFDHYVDDASAVILGTCAWAKSDATFLVGHSLGGAVCYAAATQVTEQVAGLVSVAGLFNFGSNPAIGAIANFLQSMRGVERLVRKLGLGVAGRFLGRALIDRLETTESLFERLPVAGWVPGSTEPHVLQERLIRGFDWTGVNILLTMLRWASEGTFTGEGGRDYAEEFSKLDLPLLVLAGDRDRLLPPVDARPAYDLSASTDKTWKCFGDSETHWGHLDIVLGEKAPKVVWPYITDWLEERGAQPRPEPETPAPRVRTRRPASGPA